MVNRENSSLLALDEVASWHINCPEAGDCEVKLADTSKGFNWSAPRIEKFWRDVAAGEALGDFRFQRGSQGKLLVDGEQRATAIGLGFYNPWDKNADAWEDMQKEGLRRYAPQPPGPRGVLWIDIARHHGNEDDFLFRLVTHDEPWGFLLDGDHLPEHGAKLAWENFIRVIRCQKEIPYNESLPVWASGDTVPLVWGWPWDAITPMPFVFLTELASINTPEWEEFLLFTIENNPMWQLDCPMPTASTFCWKSKICQILKHREGDDYERLKILVKKMPSLIKDRIPAVIEN